MMKPKPILKVCMLALTFTQNVFTQSSRPHIVFILADDLGWNDVGFHGSEIKTPNIDKLAYDGVILNNYYVSPICTPTRGSLMTGRHPINIGLQHGVIRAPDPWGLPLSHTTMAQHLKRLGYATHIVGKVYYNTWSAQKWAWTLGLQHYVIAAPEPWGLPLDHTTMPQHLRKLGYSTHIVGKWHLGFFRPEYLPTNRGFDSHFGYWGGKEDYFDHLEFDWHLGFFKEEYLPTSRGFDSHFGYWTGKEDYYNHYEITGVFKGLDFRRNLEVVNHTAYSTEEYTKEAVKIISMHDKSKPLFLYIAHQAVHAGNGNDPLQAPQPYIDRFPYIQNTRRRAFAGMVAALDDSVGDVVRALHHSGLMDNTIIVFSTDNGGPANNYDGNAACNYPLRGTKNTMWEGGVHGVGFVHSPLLKKRHIKTDNMMHVSDWLPTLYSAAGGDVSDLGLIDGIDMWQMLRENGANIRTEILHNIDPRFNFSAIRVGDYKLVQGDISGGRDDSWYPCDPPTNDSDAGLFESSEDFNEYAREISIAIYKRHSPNTPYNIDCGIPPLNYTKNCQPKMSPCLFHIPTDPCEYNNIAEAYPAVVENLLERIRELSKTAVDPANKPEDKLANPAFHGGVWVPWQGADMTVH